MHTRVAVGLLFVVCCAFDRGIAQPVQHQQIDISNGDTVNMKSPGYPRGYPNKFRYQLTISATPFSRVVFNSQAFALEFGSSACPYDYLSINEQRFCGTNGPQGYVVSLNFGSTVTVRFVTDGSVTFPGFLVSFRQELLVPTLPPTPPPTLPPVTDPTNSRCGVPAVKPNVNDRIVGGITAVAHSWPWQIYFLVMTPQGAPQSFCGGSLINAGWVLTAAHCCFNLTASRIQILLGAHNLNEAEPEWVRRSLSEVRVHPDYNPRSSSHDFCLVKFSEPVTRTAAIIPACIPDVADPPAGTKCYVTGWGSTAAVRIQPLLSEDFSNEISVRSNRKKRQGGNVLKQADVRIIDQNTCAVQYQGENPVEPNMMCAANPGKDSCQGDSGGPLVCQIPGTSRYVLFGVASFGKGCAQPDYPGVYGRVSQVLPWIRSIAGSNEM